jgi:hypothetical protein
MRTMTVKQTVLETDELLYAAGNMIDAGGEDEVLDFYAGDKRRRNAASRAWCKMKSALRGQTPRDRGEHRYATRER